MPQAQVISTSHGSAIVGTGQMSSCPLAAGAQIGDKFLFALTTNLATPPSPPAGWTSIPLRMSGACILVLWERVVDGTEGTNLQFPVNPYHPGNITFGSAIIRDWDNVPVAFPLPQQTQTLTPNPPPFTPSWVGQDTLFMTLVGWRWARGTRPVLTAYSAGYNDGQTTDTLNDDYGTGIAFAFRNLTTGDDPGVVQLSILSSTIAHTIAIKSA